jgi:hypothetical protein
MYKTKNKIVTAFIAILVSAVFFGCEDKSSVVFENPLKGRLINLTDKIDVPFKVIREGDTITYNVFYDDLSKLNYLVKSESDTVFVGTVTKRNELFLLNRKLDNGKFLIHAIKFNDSTVIGLETEWIQNNIIKTELDSGNYTELIIDTSSNITLETNKRKGKEIFRLVIEKLTPEKLISPNSITYEDNKLKDTTDINEKKELITDNKIVNKVYPNPFIDFINVELVEKAPYVFHIFDAKGQHLKTVKLNTDDIKINLPNLKSGQYLLKVINTNKESETIRLIKT